MRWEQNFIIAQNLSSELFYEEVRNLYRLLPIFVMI